MQRFTPLTDLPALPRAENMGILMFSGSCFAQHVARYFEKALWPVSALPFGPVYQPAALLRQWQWLLNPEAEDPLIFQSADGLWRSWLAHHKLAAVSAGLLEQKMRVISALWQQSLAEALLVGLTVSHPYTYHHHTTGVVANCHKQPASHFERRLHSVEDCCESLRALARLIRFVNPTAPVVFTLSPVRNLSLGFASNFLGKAVLRVALEKVLAGEDNLFYFPAYEIMMDDLRDYRYYAPDMIHPTEQAADYIADMFCRAFLAPSLLPVHKQGQSLAKRRLHKPIVAPADTEAQTGGIELFVWQHWPPFAANNKKRLNFVFSDD